MSRFPVFIFQYSIMSKWLAKHISTKVTFKITIRKRHVYIDIGWPWICSHVTGYINRKRSFPNCMFVLTISLKCTLHIYFIFYMNSNFHTLGIIWYFFAYYVTRCTKFSFQFSIMSKWLAKHINTKVSFKFTIRKRHVYIGIGWPIWEFEMMIELKK